MDERRSASASFRASAAILGGLLLALGLVAFAVPFVAAIATELALGGVFVAAGVLRIVYASRGGASRGGIEALLGVLTILAGALMLLEPVLGLLALTLVLGGYLIVHGALESYAALQWRKRKRSWGWMMFGGLASLALGVIILLEWPVTGLFAIGLVAGVHLVVVGAGLLMAAMVGAAAGRPGPTPSAAPA